jgi:hypothetical protein
MPLLGPDDQPDDARSDSGRHRPRSTPLTPREQRVLDRIEDDLTSSDPGLASRMAREGLARAAPSPAGPRIRMITAAVLVLVISAQLTPSGWALLAVIVTLVVLPGLLLWLTERGPGA